MKLVKRFLFATSPFAMLGFWGSESPPLQIVAGIMAGILSGYIILAEQLISLQQRCIKTQE